METVMTIFGIVLSLFATIGVIIIFALLGGLYLVKQDAMTTFDYEQDDNADEQ